MVKIGGCFLSEQRLVFQDGLAPGFVSLFPCLVFSSHHIDWIIFHGVHVSSYTAILSVTSSLNRVSAT